MKGLIYRNSQQIFHHAQESEGDTKRCQVGYRQILKIIKILSMYCNPDTKKQLLFQEAVVFLT